MKFKNYSLNSKIFLIVLAIGILNTDAICQTKPQDGSATKLEEIELGELAVSFSLLGPDYCEATLRGLEDVFVEANKQQTKDAYLLIIMRLGKGERTTSYESRRKHMEAWTKRYYGEKYIIAGGNRAVDAGRAEIYVNGKLFFVLGFKWNHKYICMG